MKAFALTAADQPASLVDLPDPEVAPGGARVRVHAASINGFDLFQASGGLTAMMPHELPTVVGRDFSGVVDAVGEGRTDVAVGDEVLGFIMSAPPLHAGAFAELVSETDKLVLARKPAALSFEQAATIPLAGATALDAVEAVEPGPGDTVLIVGATGGVGSFAVQLAAQRGARVIATAKAGEEEAYVRSLGATETIDYDEVDVAETIRVRYPDGVDAVIDVVNRDKAACAMVSATVRDGGRVATTVGAADIEDLAKRGVRGTNVFGMPTAEKLAALAGQVVAGMLSVRVQTFPFSETAAALASFSGGKVGKLVLEID
jgi:NADPH:quinone reductase-like Zn-dependent oxidoreductase